MLLITFKSRGFSIECSLQKEVIAMSIYEYDEEGVLAMLAEEYREDGLEIGMAQGREQGRAEGKCRIS